MLRGHRSEVRIYDVQFQATPRATTTVAGGALFGISKEGGLSSMLCADAGMGLRPETGTTRSWPVFLDDYKLFSLTLQIQHPKAFRVWDNAGAIANAILKIWPDLEVTEGQPNQQTLRSPAVQVTTGIGISTIILSKVTSIDPVTVNRISETYKIWKNGLGIEQLTRLSTRAFYQRDFGSLGEANTALRQLNLVRWPTGKTFDQPEESELNVPEVTYKFEDSKSFSFLRLRTEQLKFLMKPEPPFDDKEFSKEVTRLVVDYDRGLLGSIDANRFLAEEWFKGFQHILRRDLERLLGLST
jgi:hypothetical protein